MEDADYLILQDAAPAPRARRIALRTWRPGDGLACSNRSSDHRVPCTRPVAVTITKTWVPSWRGGREALEAKTTKRVVCANHIPCVPKSQGEINIEAARAASERLALDHWADYQKYLAEETTSRQLANVEFLDSAIKDLVVRALRDATAA